MRQEILQASPAEFWFWIALLALAALAAFYGLFRYLHRVRLIEDTPTSRIRSAAQGYVELTGRAEPLDGMPIVAPLSQLQCVWYDYRIEEQRTRYSGARRRRKWHTVERGRSDGLFRIRDATGEAVVDPDGAEVTPSVRQVWYGASRHPGGAPPAAGGSGDGLLGGLGLGISFGFGHYRYTERRIMPATQVFVIGQYRTLGSGSGDRSQEIGMLIRDWKKNQAEMLARFDANGDGEVDLQEWDAVRQEAERQVDAELRERQASPPVNVIAYSGIARRPFMISVHSQEQLGKRYRVYASALLAAFLGLGAAAVWALGVRAAGV